MKRIYELEPLESVGAKALGIGEAFSVLRVPGGWIYQSMQGICFVPFDSEFQEKVQKKAPAKRLAVKKTKK
jgi:hypothetical protein